METDKRMGSDIFKESSNAFGKNDNKKIHVHIEMTFVRLRGIKRACVRG